MRSLFLALAFGLIGLGLQFAHAHDSEVYEECYEYYEKSEYYMSAEDKAEQKGNIEEARKLGMLAKVAIIEFNQCQAKHGGN